MVVNVKYNIILQNIRMEFNLTQEKIANILGIDRRTYSHYETSEKIIPIKHLIALSDYFNVSIDYLFGLTDVRQYKNVLKADKIVAGIRLKEFRNENKLTQVKLASILNTTFSSIAFNEKGRNYIATPFLYTICSKYHISADYLLGKTKEPKYLK